MNKLQIAWYLFWEILTLPFTDVLVITSDKFNKQETLAYGRSIITVNLACLGFIKICKTHNVNPETILKIFTPGGLDHE